MQVKIVTIDAVLPFLEVLAARLLEKTKDNPMALAEITVILPTRRACRSLKEAFIRLSAGRVLLLPRMFPVSSPEDTGLFVGEDIPPAISALERKMILTRLIMAKPDTYGIENPTPEKAAMLADSLAEFLDEAYQEGVDLNILKDLVPENFAAHWQEILRFLQIITEEFPKILEASGRINPADRMVRLLLRQAEEWRKNPPSYPVIAAGITGSLPATAALLKVISQLPEGLVILPGLDKDMDEESFAAVDASHPQYEMKRVLENMGVNREDVTVWEASADTLLKERERLVKEALRPAAVTDKWLALPAFVPETLAGVQRIECDTINEEALSIALALRETLETPEKRAMLVTSDRSLAKRVVAQVKRWGIMLDDSAGEDITETPVGVFLRLIADAAAANLEFRNMLALLKHPLAAAGMSPPELRILVRKWEKSVRKKNSEPMHIDWAEKKVDFTALPALFQSSSEVNFADMIRAHMELAEALATSDDTAGALRLWKGEAGQTAAALIAEITAAADIIGSIEPLYYPALFHNLLKGNLIRPKFGMHPRLEILGPIEARMQKADRIIIAGLNEGSFPKAADVDPWLSRQMRAQCGLPPPEAKIGIAAHDFMHLFCAPEVILTRSLKADGTPTVPSRWLLRMDALIDAFALNKPQPRQNFAAISRKIDRPEEVKPILPPEPRPPLEARPRRLSVTEIETLMRDPYAIYAKHILKLLPLKEIDYEPGRAEYGTVLHRVFELFIKESGGKITFDAKERILALGHKAFSETGFSEAIYAFWWPRFERVAEWFAEKMRQRENFYQKYICESKGSLIIEAPAGEFNLTAKVDRIDINEKNGEALIIDYKTGQVPVGKTVENGYAPQLPLEVVMLEKGAFAEAGEKLKTAGMEFWKLSGGSSGSKTIPFPKDKTVQIAADVYEILYEQIKKFDNPEFPYAATPRADEAPPYSDYEHLERVKEWSVGRNGENEE